MSATYQPRFNLKEEAPAAGWRPFLRQGIQVAKRSVQLAREMTVWALIERFDIEPYSDFSAK